MESKVQETKIDIRIIQDAKIESKVQEVLATKMEFKVQEVQESKIGIRFIQEAKMEVRIRGEMGLIFILIAVLVLCPSYMTHAIRNIENAVGRYYPFENANTGKMIFIFGIVICVMITANCDNNCKLIKWL